MQEKVLSLLFYFFEFFKSALGGGFSWCLSDSKSPPVSRTLLSILTDLKNVVWIDATRPFISNPASPSTNSLVTVPSVPITISMTVTFMFHSFFSSPERPWYLSLFPFFQFYPVVSRNGKVFYQTGSLFLLTISRSGRLAEIRWSIFISKSHKSWCISFSRTDFGLCIFYSLESFSRYLLVFPVSCWFFMSDSKFPHVFRTLLRTPFLNNAVVWMVTASPLISKSFSPCTNTLVTTECTYYNWYDRHFHVP